MMHQFKVKWHEEGWPKDVHETKIDMWARNVGEHVASEIAETENEKDFENFRSDTTIVILSPEDIAGTYRIAVDMVLSFSAYATND